MDEDAIKAERDEGRWLEDRGQWYAIADDPPRLEPADPPPGYVMSEATRQAIQKASGQP
jgi:hypothetical protein